ncbi:MAG: hypothetical protein D6738_01985 [Acidobacteria bacterium]|nr:MAG: hypothetical protein D6738_01985 [Acidobacteriota bacterium]
MAVMVAIGLVSGGAMPVRADDASAARGGGAGASAGDYALLLNADGSRLIVFSAATGRLVQYGVNWSGSPQVVGARDVGADLGAPLAELLASGKSTESTAEVALPDKDAPGEDPPGFPRLEGLVRTGGDFTRERDGTERWQAHYLTRRPMPALFEEFRDAFAKVGIRLTSWNVDSRKSRAALYGRRDNEEWAVRINRSSEPGLARAGIHAVFINLERSGN